MKVRKYELICALIGILLIAAGFFLLGTAPEWEGSLRFLPAVLLGGGFGSLMYSVEKAIHRWMVKQNPELEKEERIEANDERILAITDKAKAKAHDGMLILLGVLFIIFLLMDTPLIVQLLVAVCEGLGWAMFAYYKRKYQKEM